MGTKKGRVVVESVQSHTLRFIRDEKTNAVTFQIKDSVDKKILLIKLPLDDFGKALMAGMEVKCKLSMIKKGKK